ncbi:YXWGXW repeat-containing protein [Terriglobus roseus]|uniref:YXWGXW repeat-containing protein n=1 Tax=Terriglobus roseus TaxID=392734 RepID=A0A1G7LBQ8_9BACT|nr:YXWGXW repeat-containing protein [Terriglobus roseus]SDF46957.1 YXWGXW repeat-containing protein [Terriglobus roseus]
MYVPTSVRTSVTTLAIAAASLMAAPMLHAQWGIAVNVGVARTAPPPLPVMEQPMAPGDGYIWTPGYWAWDDQVQDYYWVDGEWVMAPETGLLWTPGYWAYGNGGYMWNAGYWGPEVGFYGGVNYGFGYFGTGYEGGYWNGNRFFYNTAVNRVDMRFVHNTFVRPVGGDWNRGGARVSFNGGPGGLRMQPNRDEQRAIQDRRFGPTMTQRARGFDRGAASGPSNNGFRGQNPQDFHGNDGRGNDGRGNDSRGNGFVGNGQQPVPNGGNNGMRWSGGNDNQNRPPQVNTPNPPQHAFPQGQVNAPNPPRRDFPTDGGRGNNVQQNTPAPRNFDRPVQNTQPNDFRGGGAQAPQGGNRFGGGDRPNFSAPQGNHNAPSGMRGFGRF